MCSLSYHAELGSGGGGYCVEILMYVTQGLKLLMIDEW